MKASENVKPRTLSGPLWVGLCAAALVACGGNSGGADTPADAGSGGDSGGPGAGGTGTESGGTGPGGGSGGGPVGGGGSAGMAGGGPQGGTPVALNGALHVCGTELCNQENKPIQLRGMSTHGLQWYGWGDCINEASIAALSTDWGADILRVSLYVQEGGYETNPAAFRTQVDTIVDAVVAQGMYVLLDWHMLTPGDPMYNLDRAEEYFSYMAERHGDKPNVLYEIANEPSGVPWATIKSYAERVIPVIRERDPDAVVLVGTREWSSFGLSGDGGPNEVIENPVNASNVMYTFHFYAASHTDYHRNGLAQAVAALPVFVTEFGTQEYTGDGPNDFASAEQYISLMAEHKVSWTSWNFSDDERSGAAFVPGTCPGGPWSGASLKEAGAWVRDKIQNPPDDF